MPEHVALLCMMQGTVKDAAGNGNLPINALQFTRVAVPLMEATAYRVLLPPSLTSVT